METKAKKDKNPTINIHDCLKMIGMKEIVANVYSLPSSKNEKPKV